MYDNDITNLSECYMRVHQPAEMVKDLYIPVCESNDRVSFPGIRTVKVFIQKPGRGADLTYMINVKRVDSDNGSNGVIISGEDGDNMYHVTTTQDGAQVKVIDSKGMIENDFVTRVKPKFDSASKELIIIQVEEL